MLLNHARLPARLDPEGRIVTLDRQDRGRWDTREIAEGVRVLQSALAVQRPRGRYQIEAAIAALHDDAASAEETDWPQILAWYDDLVALTDDPVRQDPAAVLGRAVAVGHVLGPAAGLRETDRLREVIGSNTVLVQRRRTHSAHPERRAAVIPIFCRYLPFVRLDNGARDGQSHAHAFRLGGEERLEDLFSLSSGMPGPRSDTDSWAKFSTREVRMLMMRFSLGVSFIASMPFTTRFRMTC